MPTCRGGFRYVGTCQAHLEFDSAATETGDVKVVMRGNQRFVLGARCTKGDYRGLSLSDRPITWFKPSWYNFELDKGAEIHVNLPVVKDDFNAKRASTHYTLAPKDDMTYELFMVSLKFMADQAVPIGKQGAAK